MWNNLTCEVENYDKSIINMLCDDEKCTKYSISKIMEKYGIFMITRINCKTWENMWLK